MKKLLGVALVLTAAAACGGSPTAPAARIQSAIVKVSGPLVMDSCVGVDCFDFHFDLINEGPGCVDPTTLEGNIVLNDNGTTSSATWTLTLGSQVGIFMPNQTRRATRDSGILKNLSSAGSATTTISKMTTIACP